MSFDPVEIDKERGVILEEWRLGLGANERIQNAQFPILLNGSRYAERLPIGSPDIIRNVSHDNIERAQHAIKNLVNVRGFNTAGILNVKRFS